MKQKVRVVSIKLKILLPTSLIIIAICLVMGINSFHRMEKSMIAMGVEQAEMAAEIASQTIDGDMVAKIGEGSEGTEEYQNLLVVMRNMQKSF